MGHALDNTGIQTGSSIEMRKIRPGDRIYLSFPILTNASDQPIVVLGASFTALPHGVRLLSYKRFTLTPAVGHLLTYKLDDPAVPGYGALPKPFNGRLRIEPGATSPHYYVGDVVIEQPHRQHVSGCRVVYETDGTKYAQTLGCDFSFTPPNRRAP